MSTSSLDSAMGRPTWASPIIWLSAYGAHNNDVIDGFASRYGVHRSIYSEIETCEDLEQAILGEKRINKRNHVWKIKLVQRGNHEPIGFSETPLT